jgi:hypothetical protein
MNTPVQSAEPRYDWLHFASRSGDAGRAWAQDYRRHADLVETSNDALDLMRRNELESGYARLRDYAAGIEALDSPSRSMRALLDRWYHGVAGYYFYCRGDFEYAERSMCAAHEAVVDAISEASFLVLVSVHCKEFRLHHARIARNRRHWPEMNEHVQHAWAMSADQEPLCTTRKGQPIFFTTIAAFLYSLKPLTTDEQDAIQPLVDGARRAVLLDRFVRELERHPDVVIRYP